MIIESFHTMLWLVLHMCSAKADFYIFAKPKDRVPTNRKTHAVYPIPCGDCEKVYLGQTNQESLPLTIVMVNGFVWKLGISMRALVPYIGMMEVIYHQNIYILLVGDITLTVYKVMSFNTRSPLMKTLDCNVKILGRECNLCVVISFI